MLVFDAYQVPWNPRNDFDLNFTIKSTNIPFFKDVSKSFLYH